MRESYPCHRYPPKPVSAPSNEDLPDGASWVRRHRELLEPALAAAALLAAWMLERTGAHPGFWGTLYAVSFAVAGYEALAEGTRAALRLQIGRAHV